MSYIDINKEKEKALYRVFKEIEANGKCIMDTNPGVSRVIGVRGRSLVDENKLLPPAWISKINKTVIVTPPNIIVEETNFKKVVSRFVFRERTRD